MSGVTGSSIISYPLLEQIEGLLECPCCLEPPVPPIKCCTSGHIICSFCKPKLSRCALCREKYTDTRNFPLESIFRACIISCKYSELGCEVKCKGDQYAEHLRLCSFRCINCLQCSKIVKIVDYVKHLKEGHGSFGYETEVEGNIYFHTKEFVNLYEDQRLTDEYSYFDGRWFIISLMIKSGYLYIWINLIQSSKEDENNIVNESKYSAVIELTAKSISKIPKVEWCVPIQIIQNGEPDASHCLCIPVHPTLRSFLQETPTILVGDTLSENQYSLKFSYSFISCT